MPPEKKETKAQRAERLKQEKNPWECLDEIRQFAKGGYEAVPAEWRGNYFRWWGIYPQGDGAGVLGGKGGEGSTVPYFMLRIRVPSGLLFSHQVRTIADLSRQLCARSLRILRCGTTFSCIGFQSEALPEIFEAAMALRLDDHVRLRRRRP